MTHDRGTNREDWRELARRIQVENDPKKVVELAKQLTATFAEQRRNSPLHLAEPR
jgi:hypothetical protein